MYGTTKLFFCFNDTFHYYFSFTSGYYIALGVHSGSRLYNVGVYPRNHCFHRMFDSLLNCVYRNYIEVQYVLLVVWLIYQDWFLRIYCISEPFLVCHDIGLIHYDGS